MPLQNMGVGDFASYLPDPVTRPRERILCEIVGIGTPRAYRGGRRLVDLVICERRDVWSRGMLVQVEDDSDQLGLPRSSAAAGSHLSAVDLFGIFRGPQLLPWYGWGEAWVVETLDGAFGSKTPFWAPLFSDRATGEEYIRQGIEYGVDPEPGDTLGSVTAKTWRVEGSANRKFTKARILTPELPEPPR